GSQHGYVGAALLGVDRAGDRGRVDAARQEQADGHVAAQTQSDGVMEQVVHLLDQRRFASSVEPKVVTRRRRWPPVLAYDWPQLRSVEVQRQVRPARQAFDALEERPRRRIEQRLVEERLGDLQVELVPVTRDRQ